ncbi:MAG: porin family protein [Acidobacteriaceae bacterium]|nr:porin family protein [Acidobacteriaceae bacterium]
MTLKLSRLLALLLGTTLLSACADTTAFLGTNTTPSSRFTSGVAVGTSMRFVGAEFEYAATSEDTAASAPSLKTGMASGFLQTPMAFHGLQPYFAAGAGIYREGLNDQTDTGIASNIGGGVKIALTGPVRLRVDYRRLQLGSGALFSPAHRLYAGLNLSF